MAEREERGERSGRFMGGYGRPSPPAAGVTSSPSPSAGIGSPVDPPVAAPVEAAVVDAAVPQHVVDRLKAVYAEVAAAAQESKGLHERLARHTEAETARVIAARLTTIEEHIKSLVV